MILENVYLEKMKLVVTLLQAVFPEEKFAMNGGTAINLFMQNLPRFSVDIDLIYLLIEERSRTLANIEAALMRIKERIEQLVPGCSVHVGRTKTEDAVTKLTVHVDAIHVKIETTPVLRGCVYEPSVATSKPNSVKELDVATMQITSHADMYAGKITAALTRQHPRDLFDVKILLDNEGIDDKLRKAFIVYLLCDKRPPQVVLAPRFKDITDTFRTAFDGMANPPVGVDELVKAREDLVPRIVGEMPEEHRKFLIGFYKGAPDWELLGLPNAKDLPGVTRRQQNLEKMDLGNRGLMIEKLEAVLYPASPNF